MRKHGILMVAAMVLCATSAVSASSSYDGQADNNRSDLGLYYMITGGKFVNGQTYNGNNGSGGVFRFTHDDESIWGYPEAFQGWRRDDWFPENAGWAMTLKDNGSIVYDNNGIETGSTGGFYSDVNNSNTNPLAGLYMGYSMANNKDWIYSGYFKLAESTQIDTIIGYFDGTGYNGDFDPDSPSIAYAMNIFSAVEGAGDNSGYLMPKNTGGFYGDVLSSRGEAGSAYTAGTFTWSNTGVYREYSGWGGRTDPIFRLTYSLEEPVTLSAGEYFFSHDAEVVPEPLTMLAVGSAVAGLGGYIRRRRRA
jgi:hypothetical protein